MANGKKQYGIDALEKALLESGLDFTQKRPEEDNRQYVVAPNYYLGGSIGIELRAQKEHYSWAMVLSPLYPKQGLMDAVAKIIAEEYGLEVRTGSMQPPKWSSERAEAQYFECAGEEPGRIIEGARNMREALNIYEKAQKKHDSIVGFLIGKKKPVA